MPRTIEQVAETLRNQKKGQGATLLIGAGCSVDAGIPTAAGFVEEIRKNFPQCYEQANPRNYAQCMHELAPQQRRELLSRYIEAAKINWAHICIAQLMHLGYVDRVLTTNFDPLLLRACALLGFAPAVYDLAASGYPTHITVPIPSVFYLHGQHTGIKLMNTEEECRQQSQKLAPVFSDAGREGAWIVVGYSGENDPLFDHLAKVETFHNNLYWVGYLESQPSPFLQEKLLADDKYAFFVNGFGASGFFIGLCQRLNCFPPDLIAKPFSHLDNLLSTVQPYKIPSLKSNQPYGTPLLDADSEITEQTRKIIQDAIQKYEKEPSPGEYTTLPIQNSAFVLKAQKFLMAGQYDNVVEIRESQQTSIDPELADPISWAYVMRGRNFSHQAMSSNENDAMALFLRATAEYSSALEVKSDRYEAYIDWGNAFFWQIKMFPHQHVGELAISASQKYENALALNPNSDRAYLCWAEMLRWQYSEATPKNETLFSEANGKYVLAYGLNTEDAAILRGWADLLVDKAKSNQGTERQSLLDAASEKYEAALALSSAEDGLPATLNNYAVALIEKAGNADEIQAEQAEEAFLKAERMLKSANTMTDGLNSYNLACLYASWGKVELCKTWLEWSRNAGALASFTPEFVAKDHLLDKVKDFAWFQSFVAKGADTNWWTNNWNGNFRVVVEDGVLKTAFRGYH